MNDKPRSFKTRFLFPVLTTMVIIPMGVALYREMWPQMRVHELLVRENVSYPLLSLEVGDDLYDKMRLPDAAGVYKRILRENPGDYEALWRLARCYSMLGILDKNKRRLYIPMAIDYSRRAVRRNDLGFEGHLYLAEALGISLKYESPKNKVLRAKEIKNEAERSIRLNPSSYKAYLILGMWHRNVVQAGWFEIQLAHILFGRIPHAGLDEAVRNLKRSIELNPDFIKTHYELALSYAAQNEYNLAIEELETTMKCPVTNYQEDKIKANALAMLGKLRKIVNREA